MRLIDADALKESIGPVGLLIAYRDPEVKRIKNVIDNQPTAYDVDKVIERLEYHAMYTLDSEIPEIYLDTAISVVKGAVKDE